MCQTVRKYEKRYWIYIFVIVPAIFIHVLESFKVVPWTLSRVFMHLPLFFIGTAICDIEFMEEWRPLDYVRFENWGLCILRNCVLLFIFLSYGMGDRWGCYLYDDERCPYVFAILAYDYIPFWIGIYFAAMAIMLLIFTSEWT